MAVAVSATVSVSRGGRSLALALVPILWVLVAVIEQFYAAAIFVASITESTLAYDAFIRRLLWEIIDDAQLPAWQVIADAQTPTWSIVEDGQDPNWQNIETSP